MPSPKTTIAQAIVAKLEELVTSGDLTTVTFDKVRLTSEDFREHEFPVAQLIDNNRVITHERSRALVDWSCSIELVLKSSQYGEVDQEALWDLEDLVDRKLFESPQLGVPGVVHLIHDGGLTDLHMIQPCYYSRIDFTVRFYKDLVGPC